VNIKRDPRRGRLARLCGLSLVLALLLTGCPGYGSRTVAGGVVQTEGEHCAITLPTGWKWRPASWTAISPLGTELTFTEGLYGRPANPDWEASRDSAIQEAQGKADVQVSDDGNTVRIDFGPQGGLSYLHRFDRAGCQLTFSYKKGAREQEEPTWDEIIGTLQRTTPHS
jgi:hypothetical protein